MWSHWHGSCWLWRDGVRPRGRQLPPAPAQRCPAHGSAAHGCPWVLSCLLPPRNIINIRIWWNYYHCCDLQCGPATGKMEQSKCCRAEGRGSPNLKAARPYSQLLLAVLQHIEEAPCGWVSKADASVGSGTALQGQLCPREMPRRCPSSEFYGL